MPDLAVIMGATGALGTAIVDAFAGRGDRVIAVARSRAEVSQLAAKYPISPSPAGEGADAAPGACRFMMDVTLGTAWWSTRPGRPPRTPRRRHRARRRRAPGF